jgi:hypothetical protein
MTTLVKREDRYDLYGNDGSKIASSAQNPFGKLSKENCDDLFEVIDVEKLATDYDNEDNSRTYGESLGSYNGYIRGFQDCLELNKDKVFTAEDMNKAFNLGKDVEREDCNDNFQKYLQSLQQLNEIEVGIEMLPYSSELTESEVRGFEEHAPNSGYKLDKNGCLILRKK